ncbi:MAG: sigma 54-interacting transcriptional regulator [Bacteriovoracaceae bacterium]|nr:sigma 54-interacting transcriptional regulator [Bacteriovoracaceae bacterium]
MLKSEQKIVGSHPKFQKSLETARNVAVTKTPVLISGEAGCGKKTLGQYIHLNSVRKNGVFEVVDCSADIAEVERRVLGFREADGRFQRGVLEVANGGTVIFAHIDALDDNFQKRLYTILQELPDYELDVRVLATTTKNLSKLVGAGKFSRALLTYFGGAQIHLMPLRERGTDVELLAREFAQEWCNETNSSPISIAADAQARLNDQAWNNNLTELRQAIRNASSVAENGMITAASFQVETKRSEGFSLETDEDGVKLMSLKDAEKLLIKKALVFTSENRTQAAKILGVSIRTLRNKINEYRSEGSQYFVNLR